MVIAKVAKSVFNKVGYFFEQSWLYSKSVFNKICDHDVHMASDS